MTEKNKEYILGTNLAELERLEFQHKVWSKITDDFLDRTGIKEGYKCMDVGAGPGFVASDIRKRAGSSGEVTVVEPSELYLDHFKKHCMEMNWTNIKFLKGNFEESNPEQNYYDFIYSRWVIDFVPKPGEFLLKIIGCLKTGGVVAIQDYVYVGVSLFPDGGPFDNISNVIRAYWKSGGGDPFFTMKIPPLFRECGVEMIEFNPVIRAGGPDSEVYEWADRFMSNHLELIHQKGIISREQCDELNQDWVNHKNNPDSIFITPVIMNIIGKKIK